MKPFSNSTHEQAVLGLARQRPLLRARDLAKQALPTVVLSRLVTAGKLERVARGIYSLPGRALSEHRSLAEVALRVPRGVVCLLSALRVHGIGIQAPFDVWLAIPHRTLVPRLDQPAVHAVRMSGSALAEGIDRILVDGAWRCLSSTPPRPWPTASSTTTKSVWTWRLKRCVTDGLNAN